MSKWFRTGRPPSSAVVACARVYDADIVVGFVCAGIMTVDDVQRDVERRLKFVPTKLLLAELMQRGEQGTHGLKHSLAPEWDQASEREARS
ncbi:hypothetical protein C5E11_03770 [Clavibacter michiganensis]|nr:hypothetical protein C5E11_03770 [Clavibacter michiganensis]